jgi:hypothetical protein
MNTMMDDIWHSNIRLDITLSDICQMSNLISGLTSEMNIPKIQISAQRWFALAIRGQGCEFIFGRASWNISYLNCCWFALTMRGLRQSHIGRSCCLISVKPRIVPISLILSIGKFFTSIQLSSCNHKTLITQRSKASETGPD